MDLVKNEEKKQAVDPATYVGFISVKADSMPEAAYALNEFSGNNTKKVEVIVTMPLLSQVSQRPYYELLIQVHAPAHRVELPYSETRTDPEALTL